MILGVLSVLFFIKGWWFLGLIFTAIAVSRLVSGERSSGSSVNLENSPEDDSRRWGAGPPRPGSERFTQSRVPST